MDLEIKSLENLESPKIILGICPSCEKKSRFNYLGLQDGYGYIKDFSLYTCTNCSSAVSRESIKILK